MVGINLRLFNRYRSFRGDTYLCIWRGRGVSSDTGQLIDYYEVRVEFSNVVDAHSGEQKLSSS